MIEKLSHSTFESFICILDAFRLSLDADNCSKNNTQSTFELQKDLYMKRCPNNIVMIVVLLLIITGGVFITSGLFKDIENAPKEFFIIISITFLLFFCFASHKGLYKLLITLQSNLLLHGIIIVCMLTSVHGFLQYFGLISSNHSAFPITGTFENPAGFAAVQAAMFPFVFTKCFDKAIGKVSQLFTIAVSVLCFVSVVLSGSRTGFIALCSVIVVVFAFTEAITSFFKTHRWLWAPMILLTASILVLLYHIKPDSADGRLFIWSRCFEMIKEHPLLGYGASGFHRCYMSAQADYFRVHQESPFIMLADNVTHPFNEYIKLTIQFGMVGFFAAIFLLIWIIWKLFKSEKKTKVLGLSFVASLFIMCQFSYPFRYAVVWLMCFIAITPAVVNWEKQSFEIPSYIRIVTSSLMILILATTLRRMYYDMKWAEISKRALIGQVDRMLKYYEGMPSDIRHNPLFLYNYAAELNYSKLHEKSIALTLKCAENWNDYDVQILFASNYAYLHDAENAIRSFDLAYDMIPCRFEPLYGKMLVYLQSNDTVNALRMANEIYEKPVKIQSNRVSFIVECAQQLLIDLE